MIRLVNIYAIQKTNKYIRNPDVKIDYSNIPVVDIKDKRASKYNKK